MYTDLPLNVVRKLGKDHQQPSSPVTSQACFLISPGHRCRVMARRGRTFGVGTQTKSPLRCRLTGRKRLLQEE